jgi:hypothetical protein
MGHSHLVYGFSIDLMLLESSLARGGRCVPWGWDGVPSFEERTFWLWACMGA